MLRADRWGRLREGVRRCQLRRGAWYPVLRVGTDAAVVVVRHQSVIVPPSYLEIVDARPSKWTLIARERYAVCPTARNAWRWARCRSGCGVCAVAACSRWSSSTS